MIYKNNCLKNDAEIKSDDKNHELLLQEFQKLRFHVEKALSLPGLIKNIHRYDKPELSLAVELLTRIAEARNSKKIEKQLQ